MSTELTLVQKANSIKEFINRPEVVKQLEAALPEFLTPKRFLRTFYTAILRNPSIMDCTRESLLSCMISMGQLGLEPVLGKAAIVPYGAEAQFQPMYRGLIDLARRTSNILITAHVVYENDEFDYEYGLDENIHHKPANGDRGKPIGAYTVWTYPETGVPKEQWPKTFLYLPASDIYEIRDKYSKAYKYAIENPNNKKAQETPWITRPGEMMKKTVIIQHSKLEPCSVEMEIVKEFDAAHEMGQTQMNKLNYMGGIDLPPDDHDINAEFEALTHEVDAELTKQFVADLVSHYKGQFNEQDIKTKALEDGATFLEKLKSWAESRKGLKGEIGRLKTTGLKEWEKANHDKLIRSLYEDSKEISDDDLNFFLSKWKNVIERDYTAEGQPGAKQADPSSGTLETDPKAKFLKEIAEYEDRLPRSAFTRALMAHGAANVIENTDPAKYEDILKALKAELDGINQKE